MVDRSTRWAEAVHLVNTSTSSCAAAFFNSWFSIFGVPAVDLGQRSAVLFGSLGRAVLHPRHLSSAHHSIPPQANGLVERFHRQLNDALRARLDNQDWPSHLPWVMLGLRVAPKEDCGLSSAEMVYGEALTLPGDFLEASTPPGDNFLQLLRERMSQFQPPPTRPVEIKPASQQEAALHKADFVLGRQAEASPRPGSGAAGLASQERQTSGLPQWWGRRPRTTSRVSGDRRSLIGGVVWRELRKKSSKHI
jgi:hypothetical protein